MTLSFSKPKVSVPTVKVYGNGSLTPLILTPKLGGSFMPQSFYLRWNNIYCQLYRRLSGLQNRICRFEDELSSKYYIDASTVHPRRSHCNYNIKPSKLQSSKFCLPLVVSDRHFAGILWSGRHSTCPANLTFCDFIILILIKGENVENFCVQFPQELYYFLLLRGPLLPAVGHPRQ